MSTAAPSAVTAPEEPPAPAPVDPAGAPRPPAPRIRRPRLTILTKLILAYVVPTLVLFSLFGVFVHDFARRDLEAELGKRLATAALLTAGQVRGKYLAPLVPGDEAEVDGAWQRTRLRLEAMKARSGLVRLAVFRPDLTSLCDTDPGVAIGDRYYELDLDRHELARVFERGTAVASVLFRGKDGVLYKAGYAPITADESDPTIVAAIRVEAPAEYFTRLLDLRRQILQSGAVLLAFVLLTSIVVATRLTRPTRDLATAAERIGRGELTRPVVATSRDEIGVLAHTLDDMREALRARDERLQMMLAGIAHEVRNPLGGIELFAGILRDELGGDDEKLGHVARIERELGHLKTVVSDFLEYARRPAPELAPLDLADLARDLADLVRGDAAAAGVDLVLDAPAPALALADDTQLRRALLNLLRNGVQATPAGGRVTLAVRAGEDGVLVTVTDTGRGIAPGDLARIFTPFYTTKEKGTGLGLAFVKEILADHGGTIDVDSTVGRGTTFTIRLRGAPAPA